MGSGDNKVLVLADDFNGANDRAESARRDGDAGGSGVYASYQGEAQALDLGLAMEAQPAVQRGGTAHCRIFLRRRVAFRAVLDERKTDPTYAAQVILWLLSWKQRCAVR